MTEPNHEVERFAIIAETDKTWVVDRKSGLEGELVRYPDYEKDIAAAEEEARVYAEAQTKAEEEVKRLGEAAGLRRREGVRFRERARKLEAELDQAREKIEGLEDELEDREQQIDTERGELGLAEEGAEVRVRAAKAQALAEVREALLSEASRRAAAATWDQAHADKMAQFMQSVRPGEVAQPFDNADIAGKALEAALSTLDQGVEKRG